MLFKLSLKNIVKSIKDYAIYFFTLVLGVAIFYVFNAIESQTVMMKVSDNTAEIIRLMKRTPWSETPMETGWELYFICFRIFNYLCFEIFNKKKKQGVWNILNAWNGKKENIFYSFY